MSLKQNDAYWESEQEKWDHQLKVCYAKLHEKLEPFVDVKDNRYARVSQIMEGFAKIFNTDNKPVVYVSDLTYGQLQVIAMIIEYFGDHFQCEDFKIENGVITNLLKK